MLIRNAIAMAATLLLSSTALAAPELPQDDAAEATPVAGDEAPAADDSYAEESTGEAAYAEESAGESAYAAESTEAPVADEAPVAEIPATEAPAAEPAGPTLIPIASFVSRYELRIATDDAMAAGGLPGTYQSDLMRYRARFGVKTTPIDVGEGRTVTVSFVPQAGGTWGDASGGLADPGVGVHIAKLRISGAKNWVDVGRFEMIYGEHLVIGNVGWHHNGQAFNGVRGRMDLGQGAWLDLFFTQLDERSSLAMAVPVDPVAAGDEYFTGAYAGLGPMLGEMELDAYVLARIFPSMGDMAPGIRPLVTLGSRFKQAFGDLTVRAEGGLQLGSNQADQSVLAFQGDADAMMNLGKAKAGLGAFYASGDDTTTEDAEGWDQLYPTGHKFLGLMDIIVPRTNIMGAVGKGRLELSPKVSLAGDLHMFMRPEGTESYAGTEADLWAVYKLGKGLGLRGGYSIFLPNEDMYVNGDPVHYLEIQFGYNLN